MSSLRTFLCGGVWNGFLLGRAKQADVPCQVHLLMSFRIRGSQRRGDGKIAPPPPSSEGRGG